MGHPQRSFELTPSRPKHRVAPSNEVDHLTSFSSTRPRLSRRCCGVVPFQARICCTLSPLNTNGTSMESLFALVGLAIALFASTNVDDAFVLVGFFADP